MNKAEYIRFHERAADEMKRITAAKNADYTGGSPSPFANFSRVEEMGICTTEQGILARMTDKFSRLASLTKQDAQVKGESLLDTCLDLANYAIILAAYVQSKAKKSEPEQLELFGDASHVPADYSQHSTRAANARAP